MIKSLANFIYWVQLKSKYLEMFKHNLFELRTTIVWRIVIILDEIFTKFEYFFKHFIILKTTFNKYANSWWKRKSSNFHLPLMDHSLVLLVYLFGLSCLYRNFGNLINLNRFVIKLNFLMLFALVISERYLMTNFIFQDLGL